ncbi:MAG: hypothetical protein IID37_12650, partial [Planctomycetes bacterium]|nr:hypothetical protein [Planctomycetota bacterium]
MIVICKKLCGLSTRLPQWPRILVAVGFFAVGCTSIPSGTGTGTNGDDGAANDNVADSVGSIDNVSSTVTLSGNREFNVIYSIPVAVSLVEAIYVQVADAVPGSAEVGERVVFGQALASGDSQAVLFDTTLLDPGLYRVGISYIDAFGVSVIVFSDGVVDVQGQPDPVFFEPAADITGEAGISLLVSFDAGDPENVNVRWRLFYADKTDIEIWAVNPAALSNQSELGTQLTTGSTNVGSFTWNTAGLQPGEYGLGVSATDSGSSIDQTEDNQIVTSFVTDGGQLVTVTLVEPEPLPMPPTLIVTSPSTDINRFPGDDVTISWDASFFEGPLELLSVVRDGDGDLDTTDDQTFVLSNDSSGLSSFTLTTSELEDGEFHIAVIANDGLNDPVVRFASGTVTVDDTVIFSADSPSNNRIVPPGTLVDVSWSSNVPSTLATYDVIVQADPTGDGTDLGDPVFLAIDTTSTSVSFDTTGLSGLFVFTVTMTVSSLDNAEFVESPVGNVRVSTAPPVIWLGALTDTQGAIFQGVNFEDNAGSAFTTVGDMDGDGNDDFIIVARYGKPFLDNSSGGIGHGEAYLIYGSGERLSGELSLNSVGTDLLRGLTFTGIRTPQGTDDTDGLADVSRVPDVDNDGRDEIVFGFPNVDSRGHNVDPRQDGVQPEFALGSLEKHDQFLRGGIVIVSSKNSILQSPTIGTPVINLDMVGQDFDVTCVQREPEVAFDEWFQDVLSLEENDGVFTCEGSCAEPSTDGDGDSNSIIQYGFHNALADDYWNGQVLSGSSCTAGYDSNDCFPIYLYCDLVSTSCDPFSPGLHYFPINGTANFFLPSTLIPAQYSGFYPYEWDIDPDEDDENDIVLNQPREPLGARILGVGLGDGFGASITLSNVTGTGAGDVIISAPNRTAIGILRQTQESSQQGPEDGGNLYVQGGEIDGLEVNGNWTSHTGSGVAYLFKWADLWE